MKNGIGFFLGRRDKVHQKEKKSRKRKERGRKKKRKCKKGIWKEETRKCRRGYGKKETIQFFYANLQTINKAAFGCQTKL